MTDNESRSIIHLGEDKTETPKFHERVRKSGHSEKANNASASIGRRENVRSEVGPSSKQKTTTLPVIIVLVDSS